MLRAIVWLALASAGCGPRTPPPTVVVVDAVLAGEPCDLDVFLWRADGEELLYWARVADTREFRVPIAVLDGSILRCDAVSRTGCRAWSAEVRISGSTPRVTLELRQSDRVYLRRHMPSRIEIGLRPEIAGRMVSIDVTQTRTRTLVGKLALGRGSESIRTDELEPGTYTMQFDGRTDATVEVEVRAGAFVRILR